MTRSGALVISLDFELRWGVRDVSGPGDYDANLYGARRAIPRLLALFQRYDVHATWATVGLLFARTRDELLDHRPAVQPSYVNPDYSPYPDLEKLGSDERADPLSFAPSLLEAIAETPGQEIGSHTFSHYYALEPGQTEEQFQADLVAARAIGARYGDVLTSLVLPRNQWNPRYLPVLRALGVRGVRVNRDHWAYRAARTEEERVLRRAYRLLDSCAPLSGPLHVGWPDSQSTNLIVASHFVRPCSQRLALIREVRLQRIKREMRRAATSGSVLHLWWHPHNMGVNTDAFLSFIEALLHIYRQLRDAYGFRSLSMRDLTRSAP